ncbi:MAG: hypothetical protein ACLT98_15200 [Eggerthellaceae bacterium]
MNYEIELQKKPEDLCSCPSTRSNLTFSPDPQQTASTAAWSPLTTLSTLPCAQPRETVRVHRGVVLETRRREIRRFLLGTVVEDIVHVPSASFMSSASFTKSRFHPHPLRQLSSNSNGCSNLYLAHSARPPPSKGLPPWSAVAQCGAFAPVD